ncbi:MAG: hypothetical protein H7Y09_00250 [Chitinophagaceae bacterium]|nr:hypothetical protein [Anaerolineae bacterium]
MATGTIPVDEKIAVLYEQLTDEQKRSFQVEVTRLLLSIKPETAKSLDEIIHEISEEAQSRGLTPEILEALLADD